MDTRTSNTHAHLRFANTQKQLGKAKPRQKKAVHLYRPLLSSTENFERWKKNGSQDAAERAGAIWRTALEEYEQPPLDEGIRSQLEEYVTRRRAELGD